MPTLKEMREKKGVTQKAVADHLGVSRQTYCGYENNQDAMSISQAKAACDFLGVSVNEIFLPKNVN